MALSDQVPTSSGFDMHSTGDEVLADIDLSGRTAVVTGGYSGIGLETVRSLARRGARCIVPVRRPEKASANLADVEGAVDTVAMDLADLGSVRAAASRIAETVDRVDLLINNAGVMACPEARVGPGWESQLGINHMGHFAFTQALTPLLAEASAPRVVALTSSAHKITDIRWDDLHFSEGYGEGYDKWRAYGQSKTANALFANALSRRLRPYGGHAFSVHPGGILTPLQRHLPKEEMVALGWIDESGEPTGMASQRFKTPEQGCSTTLWAATSPKLEGVAGVYCENADVAAPMDPDSPKARYEGVAPHACDDESAERLWSLSEAMLAEA